MNAMIHLIDQTPGDSDGCGDQPASTEAVSTVSIESPQTASTTTTDTSFPPSPNRKVSWLRLHFNGLVYIFGGTYPRRTKSTAEITPDSRLDAILFGNLTWWRP